MAYNKADFLRLREVFRDSLVANGEPISCRLHEADNSHGLLTLVMPDGEHLPLHVAEACNIASVIKSIERILCLPRSNVACEEMTEVLLLRLDVLREYMVAAIRRQEGAIYMETEADRVIRRWAGFLKHPSDFVFAHSCLSSWEISFDPAPIDIDCAFLATWDGLKPHERDRKKSDLAHSIVRVKLPHLSKIEEFFESSKKHLQDLVTASSRSGTRMQEKQMVYLVAPDEPGQLGAFET